jgi:exosome complex component MTR3
MTTDRRRINGPSGGTSTPIFSQYLSTDPATQTERPTRTRKPNVLRKMCMYHDFEIIYEY